MAATRTGTTNKSSTLAIPALALHDALAATLPLVDPAGTKGMDHLCLSLGRTGLTVVAVNPWALGEWLVRTKVTGPAQQGFLSAALAKAIARTLRPLLKQKAPVNVEVLRQTSGLVLRCGAERWPLLPKPTAGFPDLTKVWEQVSGKPCLPDGRLVVSAALLSRFETAASRAPTTPLLGKHLPLRLSFFGVNKPLLVEITPALRGVLMPMTLPANM